MIYYLFFYFYFIPSLEHSVIRITRIIRITPNACVCMQTRETQDATLMIPANTESFGRKLLWDQQRQEEQKQRNKEQFQRDLQRLRWQNGGRQQWERERHAFNVINNPALLLPGMPPPGSSAGKWLYKLNLNWTWHDACSRCSVCSFNLNHFCCRILMGKIMGCDLSIYLLYLFIC